MIVDAETPEDKAAYARRVFEAMLDRRTRLRNAIQRRNAMAQQIANGEELSGYRADFIRDTAEKVVRLVASAGEAFNTIYGDDLMTSGDFADILATATNMVAAAAKGEG